MSAGNTPKKPQLLAPRSLGSLMMRRVLRQGEAYICGICKSRHASPSQANACLHTCWLAVLDRAPWVVEVRAMGKLPYACSYCQRGYSTAEQAHSCAQDCLRKISKTAAAEIQTPGSKMNRPFTKPNAKATSRLAFRQLIERAKLVDARREAELKKASEPPQFTCDNCKKTYASEKEAHDCQASHAAKESANEPQNTTQSEPAKETSKETKPENKKH